MDSELRLYWCAVLGLNQRVAPLLGLTLSRGYLHPYASLRPAFMPVKHNAHSPLPPDYLG